MDTNLLTALATILTPFLGYLAHSAVTLLKTKTKNGNLQLLLTWADQAVSMAESTSLAGPDKKAQAMQLVTSRLTANNLTNKFSQEQIGAVVEQAVIRLNAIGTTK
ncbi:Phage holin protein [Fructobacillus sp. EFB-N1]|uniref:phage holin n=1 Tax=Fructobacillus sp. EFB-N1 TaxID=1658766 RepID=UPI00064DA881|nr:phage holin [Fructobacillus sp. EFB-N1]KMK53308.1 Phage holin protein [Fructobacillus sp. EFB-N1]